MPAKVRSYPSTTSKPRRFNEAATALASVTGLLSAGATV